MNTFKLLLALLVSFGLLFGATGAWSAVEITPYFSLAQEYNDNIFLSDTDRRDDWITTIQPGLNLRYNQRSVEATVDYSLRYRLYKNNTEEDQDSFRDVQRADATVLFFSGRPFTLLAQGTITRENLDERDFDAEFSDTFNRSTVYRMTLTPEYRWTISPTLAMVLGYSYQLVDYAERAGEDYDEHQGRITLLKNLTSATDLWTRYQYTLHDADFDRDNREFDGDFDRQDVAAGISHRLGARTTLTGMVGYAIVEFDARNDTESVIWSADVSYLLSAATTLSLAYNQDFAVTAIDGLSKTREGIFTIGYQKPLFGASASISWRDLDYVHQNRNDEIYGVRLTLSRQLTQSLSAGAEGGYERARFTDDPVVEDVDRYFAGATLAYEYRRFITSLGYYYRNEDSDRDGRDFTNNIITLAGSVRF